MNESNSTSRYLFIRCCSCCCCILLTFQFCSNTGKHDIVTWKLHANGSVLVLVLNSTFFLNLVYMLARKKIILSHQADQIDRLNLDCANCFVFSTYFKWKWYKTICVLHEKQCQFQCHNSANCIHIKSKWNARIEKSSELNRPIEVYMPKNVRFRENEKCQLLLLIVDKCGRKATKPSTISVHWVFSSSFE